jgi:arsenate reductase
MLILGLQSSPRKNGSTNYLLSSFFKEIEKQGIESKIVDICKKNIKMCKGCGYCEKHGFCITKDDDMALEMYSLVREADIIVAATPIYFYHASAQMKGFIDRCQALWSRKYRYKLEDPGCKTRRGFLLSPGATKGANLFEGLEVTMKYFFDALSAEYCGGLTYRSIENPDAFKNIPSLQDDISKSVDKLVSPFLNRKKVLFACRENACRSQMASAFAQYHGGDKIEALRGGSTPVGKINPMMEEVMAEKGVDMAFRVPRSIDTAILKTKPDMIVTMGCGEACPLVPEAERLDWDFPDPAGKDLSFMREIRDQIEEKVFNLLENI